MENKFIRSPERRCGHRSPLTYDHARWATCTLPEGHHGDHTDGTYGWRRGFMPSKLNPAGKRASDV